MIDFVQLYLWEWIVFAIMSGIYIWQRHRSVVLLAGLGVFCTSLAAVLHSICMYLLPNLPYMVITFPLLCIATLWWIWFWGTTKPLLWQGFCFFCMIAPFPCILFYGIISADYLYVENKKPTEVPFSKIDEANIGDLIRVPDGRCFAKYRGNHSEVVVKSQTIIIRSEVFLFAQQNWNKNLPVQAWISSENLHPDQATRMKQCKDPMLLVVKAIHDQDQQAIHNAAQLNALKREGKTTLLRRVKDTDELLETLQLTRKGLVFSIIVSLIGFIVKIRMPTSDQDNSSGPNPKPTEPSK